MHSRSLLIVLLPLLMLSGISCWWDGGHMLVAEIAKQELVSRDPKLFESIEKYVTMLSPLCDDRSQDFVQAASWADDIKSDAMSFWYNWHFFNKPDNPSGQYIQLNPDGLINNSIEAIKRAVSELSRNYTDPIQNPSGISMQKALFMRLLIHIVGDLHQPLHNTSLFNTTYPKGDLGGNLEKILLLNKTEMILHSYFDSGALRLDGFQRPLTKVDATQLTQYANDYRLEFPRSYFKNRLLINDTAIWAQESYNIAHNFIYPFVTKSKQITKEFDTQAYNFIKEQITIGGYRLADTLLNIFVPNPKPTPSPNSKNTSTN